MGGRGASSGISKDGAPSLDNNLIRRAREQKRLISCAHTIINCRISMMGILMAAMQEALQARRKSLLKRYGRHGTINVASPWCKRSIP